jgi:hypothetical protein
MTLTWEVILKDRLQLYGHRNWLVIADSAYPAQSKQGIETIVAHDEQMTVLARAFEILRECRHLKAKIYTDQELSFVSESDAPDVTSYLQQLRVLVEGYEVCVLPHEEIILSLDRTAETFKVLLVKTNMRIPYTSVFFELECGYWNAQAEDRLRAAMRAESQGREPKHWQKASIAGRIEI